MWSRLLAIREKLGILTAACALLATAGCELSHESSLLQQQYQVGRLDYTKAQLQYLEQEYLREEAHVQALQARVAESKGREESLAVEASDLKRRIGSAEGELKDLKARAAAIEQEKAAAVAAAAAAGDPIDAAGLDARIQQLRAEADRLAAKLAALKPPEKGP